MLKYAYCSSWSSKEEIYWSAKKQNIAALQNTHESRPRLLQEFEKQVLPIQSKIQKLWEIEAQVAVEGEIQNFTQVEEPSEEIQRWLALEKELQVVEKEAKIEEPLTAIKRQKGEEDKTEVQEPDA